MDLRWNICVNEFFRSKQEIEQNLHRVVQHNCNFYKHAAVQFEKKVKVIESSKAQLETNHKHQILLLHQNLTTHSNELLKKSNQIQEFQKKRTQYDNQISSLQQTRSKMSSELESLKTDLENLRTHCRFNKIELMKENTQLKNEKDQCQQQLNKATQQHSEQCVITT